MISFLLSKRRVILFIIIPLIIFGIYSLLDMQVKLYPNTRKPVIMVDIVHPSFTSEDFYDNYGELIEQKLNSISDVDTISSLYSSGKSEFDIEFDWEIDIEAAYIRVNQILDSIKGQLPEESEDYRVFYSRFFSSYLSIAITSTETDYKELYSIVYPVLSRALTGIEDADSVEIIDIEELKAEVILDETAVLTYGLNTDEIIQAIRSGYRNQSLGSFSQNNNSFSLRIDKGVDSIFEIGNILIQIKGNKKIFLKDIAEINVNYDLPRNLYRTNGKNSVQILAIPKPDGNLKNLSRDINNAINSVRGQLPADLEFVTLLDPAEFVDKSIQNVIISALIGGILAVLIIFLILGEFKNTIIIAFSIPITIILSFILMKLFNLTINLISLSGITLAVGMIVDASVVIMENIHRHKLENPGGDLKKIIVISVNEVTGAVFASTITSICVFLPLSFTSPLANAIMGELAKTIIFTLIVSMIVSITVIPVVFYYLYRGEKNSDTKKNRLTKLSTSLFQRLINLYSTVLRWILYRKKISLIMIVGSFIVLTALIIFVLPLIRKEIVADPRSDRVAFRFKNFNCTDKTELIRIMEPIEKAILEAFQGDIVSSNTNYFSENSGRILFKLKSSRLLDSTIERLNDMYPTNTEWRFDIMPWDPSKLPLPRTYDLTITVHGPERNQKIILMEKIIDLIEKEEIYRNVYSVPNTAKSNEIMLIPRYEVQKEFPAYNLTKLGSLIRFILNGSTVLKFNVGNDKIPVNLRYRENMINSIDDINNYNIFYDDKGIPLRHFFDFSERVSLSEMSLSDGNETFSVYANMKRDDPKYLRSGYEQRVQGIINANLQVPDGYSIVFEDTQKIINDSISSLLMALAVSILLIYVVLGIQFNSTRIPLIIIISIPLGLIGVLLSLFIFNSTISLNSLLGMILLAGIVVNNSIIIIDFYIAYKKRISDSIDLLVRVCELRFTPIIMTSTTTILGMLPLALALGDGTNIIQPLGIAVCGGLFLSTFLTLFIIPAILNLINIGKEDS